MVYPIKYGAPKKDGYSIYFNFVTFWEVYTNKSFIDFKEFSHETIYNNIKIIFQRHQTETVTALTEKTLDDVSSHGVFSSTDEIDEISITTEKGT